MSISDEFAFIKDIQPDRLFHAEKVVGIGDDAAIIGVEEGFEKIVCVDTMVEGVHFTRETMKPFDIGYKALAANISDVAAMGGYPLYYLVSITIPKSWTQEELKSIYDGMKSLGEQYEMDLIGGDTTSGKTMVLSVFVIGKVENSKRLLRSNARVGDVMFVSGTVGDAAGGLDILLHNKNADKFETLVESHQRPKPQVTLGRILSKFERVSLNDVSDGLASELLEIAEASQVDIFINKETIPISEDLQRYDADNALKWALTGGEDFELVGSIPETDWAKLEKECLIAGMKITKIGTVASGEGKAFIKSYNGAVQELKKEGYNHFNRG
ncbi:thiamine-phosphate kinase [Sutcliffiella horikoshii]|uniref:Thiamine-monophosphate kinase n=1 Tax=Sutcliffiella horikoshii TaxID=79883 RepID=A0A1Y0CIN5_9BACI|nr:thiamine-phosphate kinase [Sutcliffiella horikoshii]ART74817.1 thiamine-phosphate kinase [Sutcliffiella horikoshii]TYS67365.1 thiamine-phosphate kinase [Sutcliffiella horikoshii]